MKSFRQESGQHVSGSHLTSASWTYRKLPWRCSCSQEKAIIGISSALVHRAPSVASWPQQVLQGPVPFLQGIPWQTIPTVNHKENVM